MTFTDTGVGVTSGLHCTARGLWSICGGGVNWSPELKHGVGGKELLGFEKRQNRNWRGE